MARYIARQRHSSASDRNKQAKMAFGVRGEIIKNAPYVLIDDVVTTGATIKYVTQGRYWVQA